MPLIKCKECGNEISDTSEKCVKCGAKTEISLPATQRYFKVSYILFFLCIAFILYRCSGSSPEATPPPAPAAPAMTIAYMGEASSVGNFEITVNKTEEAKQIGKYKASNMYVKVFLSIKNTSAQDLNAPHFSLINETQKELSACKPDSNFVIDNVKGTISNAEWIKRGETKTGYLPMDCPDYIKSKNKSTINSRPSDFKLFINDKLKSKATGVIHLKNKDKQEIKAVVDTKVPPSPSSNAKK